MAIVGAGWTALEFSDMNWIVIEGGYPKGTGRAAGTEEGIPVTSHQ
jgi:hypothetical protein